jgi:hypothetical protein
LGCKNEKVKRRSRNSIPGLVLPEDFRFYVLHKDCLGILVLAVRRRWSN